MGKQKCIVRPLTFLLFIFSLLAFLTACTAGRDVGEPQSIPLKYATLFTIDESDSLTCVCVADPWNDRNRLATYLLVSRDKPLPHSLPDGTIVRTPLRRAVVTTSVHAALLVEIGASQCIAGLTDTAYIISPQIKDLLKQGVRNMGTSILPDMELLRASRPDAVFVSPFENAGHGSLERLGVPLIECADYMETSPLGRAEWMRFFGRLVGKGAEADSLFKEVEKKYNSLKTDAARSKTPSPTIMCDLLTSGTWYQPGGNSTMGRLFADAGAKYLWAERKESGSLPLNLESVYARAHEADFWLVKYGQAAPLTYSQMAADCPQYCSFRPWRTRSVFACNTSSVPFYEETPFHPERLLNNLISIFHPEAASPPIHHYYLRIEE